IMMFSRGIASALLQDLGGHAGADGAAAFADRKPQLLLHRDRRDQLDRHLRVVPRHHHLHPRRQLHRPRHVRRPQVKLRPIPLEKRRVPAPLFLRQHVHLALELRVRRDRLRLRQHHPPLHLLPLPPPPRPTPLFPRPPPRSNSPTSSPACPSSNSLRNISTPVTTTFLSVPNPTISTSSFTFTFPRSIRPVATVPRPVIENTSSTGIRNGLSTSRFGTGMLASSAASNSSTFPTHALSPAIAFSAAPRITGTSSPGYSYLESSSRTSSSTRSNSSASSTRSHLFRNTTMAGTFTCRAKRMCSRVCGIGPSTAETTRIAPSICAAPVIMFFT